MKNLKLIVSGAVMLGLLVIVLCYWPAMIKWADDHEGAAAWAQAILSVGAILLAAWTVDHSHRLQVKHQAQQEFDSYTQFLENTFQLASAVGKVAEKIHIFESGSATQAPGDLESMKLELEGLVRAINQIDMTRLDRHEFILGIHAAAFHARKLIAAVDRVQAPAFSRTLEGPLLQNTAQAAKLRMIEVLVPLKTVIANRGQRAPRDIRPC